MAYEKKQYTKKSYKPAEKKAEYKPKRGKLAPLMSEEEKAQLYRSGSSIGANVRESKHAQSDADFLSKMSIAYKEADESDFWLNLLHDNGYLDDTQFNSLNIDLTRILKILTSIVKTMRQKIGKE